MSMRSMTLVEQTYDGDGKMVALYRHSDGYPAEAGAAIVNALNTAPSDCEAVVAALLSNRYEFDSGLVPSESVYRLASWMPEDQGDLEHVYIIRRGTMAEKNGGGRMRAAVASWTVTHHARIGWSEGTDDYRRWPTTTYDLAEFCALVNRERRETNARIKARGAQCDPYPMLSPQTI